MDKHGNLWYTITIVRISGKGAGLPMACGFAAAFGGRRSAGTPPCPVPFARSSFLLRILKIAIRFTI